MPALLRAKAELETRCQMLETQIAKMQVRAGAGAGPECQVAGAGSGCRNHSCLAGRATCYLSLRPLALSVWARMLARLYSSLRVYAPSLQGELEKADATNAAFEDHLDSALQTGGSCAEHRVHPAHLSRSSYQPGMLGHLTHRQACICCPSCWFNTTVAWPARRRRERAVGPQGVAEQGAALAVQAVQEEGRLAQQGHAQAHRARE